MDPKQQRKIARRERDATRERRDAMLAAERDIRKENRMIVAAEKRAEREADRELMREQARLRRQRLADERRTAAAKDHSLARLEAEDRILSVLRSHGPILAPVSIRSVLDAHGVRKGTADEAVASLIEQGHLMVIGAGPWIRWALLEPGFYQALYDHAECPLALKKLMDWLRG